MAKARTIFVCQHCGNESLKWLGRCPQCDTWDSFVERAASTSAAGLPSATVQELSTVSLSATARLPLHFAEFNRVLGGGVVPGSLVLIGGDPGIGKSTLLLQVAAEVAETKTGLSEKEPDPARVLYVSGEESVSQIKLRADRLGLGGKGLFVLPETRMEHILDRAQGLSPHLVIVDSIQTVYVEGSGAPGSVSQVRECTLSIMQWAKSSDVPVFLVGHVTKEGAIAGPRVLEHIVDVVLYLEGERFSAYRLLRGVKNRFGSTNEIGIFEMRDQGLVEITDPSQALLSQRTDGAIGSLIVPTLEGARPLLVEIQALTNPTSFGLPRRTANGVDFNRLLLVAAVLSRRGGIALSNQDIIANVAGGIKINEPAIDLGLALAIASSFRSIKIDPRLVTIGEVGLSGELRTVSQLDRRVAEAARLGFETCLLPAPIPKGLSISAGIKLRPVGTLSEALKVALG
ncbi:DNA repair protein RadA [Dehalococcoidia bacterium]|nr:DNA repair protein RadA [Dehalococcoidia bacterium]MCL0096976.1 DNA repair protein RadA [Dehalococcoidia bacterium]